MEASLVRRCISDQSHVFSSCLGFHVKANMQYRTHRRHMPTVAGKRRPSVPVESHHEE
jgi:hypothetical protein